HWHWTGSHLRHEARLDARTLERWLAGPQSASSWPDREPRYLYSGLIAMHPISLTVVSRPSLALILARLAVLLGVAPLAAPLRGKLWLLLFALVSLAALFAVEPTTAIECAQPAGVGAMLVALGGASQTWLARRQSRKRAVFPEPAVLAKTQGSSVR